jgi:hypothetical protein
LPESFLNVVESFISEVQAQREAHLSISVDQYKYFWTRLESVLGLERVQQCARAVCCECGKEHRFSELFYLTRTSDLRSGKCGHPMGSILVTWSELAER